MDSLRDFTGKDACIKEYVMQFKETEIFLQKLVDYLEFVIPEYIKEGRSQLIIGLGCTGGKHRSVVITEELTNRLNKNGHKAQFAHRDIDKN